MAWTIVYFNHKVQHEITNLPVDIYADYLRLVGLLIEYGVFLKLPHARAMGDGLYELRCKGRDGIGRVFYCFVSNNQIVMLHSLVKKTQKTPQADLNKARARLKEIKQ